MGNSSTRTTKYDPKRGFGEHSYARNSLYLGLNQFRDKELKRIKKALENKEKMIFTGEVEHGGRY